ncbi:MFS transporter [Geodermatophilus sp. SYSU D01036]
MSATTPTGSQRAGRTPVRRVAMASFIGTTIEWYDYYIFGTAAVLVFNTQFFSSLSPVAGTLASLATFGVAFVARPLGGVLFGHYGDRVGRKAMLVTSLLMMGAGTLAVGLLPSYDAIGIAAPLLLVLCRILQGIAVGGEWSGAVLMAAEHAPPGRRAFYASWPQSGVPAGVVLSSSVFFLVQLMPEDDLLSWGWRIPFIASALLVAVGLYIRLNITESPEFQRLQEQEAHAAVPFAETMRTAKRPLLLGILSLFAPNVPFYLATVFLLSYVPEQTGITRGTVLLVLIAASALEVLTIPWAAMLADRYGRRRIMSLGAVLVAGLAYPVFLLINTGSVAMLALALFLLLPLAHAFAYAVTASYISDLFEPRVRYTGSALAYQIGGMVTSAPAPFVAAALLAWSGSWTWIAGYTAAGAVVALLALYAVRSNPGLRSAPAPVPPATERVPAPVPADEPVA